jgi:uncharacterized protein YecT (DUF1311 family)
LIELALRSATQTTGERKFIRLRVVFRFFWRAFLSAISAIFLYLSAASVALGNSDDCDSASDYVAWNICVQKSAASLDEKLNRIYRKVMSKLKTSPDATKVLMTAQRKWIDFRDAQCKLDGFPSLGTDINSTVVTECIDRFAKQRTEDLLRMLMCGSIDKICIVPAHVSASINQTQTETLKQPQPADQGVPFESLDIVGNYRVSGQWFPQEVKNYAGLSGPAKFVFSDVKTGNIFSAQVSGIALLPKDYWKNKGIAVNSVEIVDLVEKLKSSGVIKITLSTETRAQIEDCNDTDICLHFGTAPVDIQDIDFSGRMYFIFRQAEEGQRWVDNYKIMKLSSDGKNLEDKYIATPLDELDGLSEINLSKKQIILQSSNGACNSGYRTYAPDPKNRSGLTLTHIKQYSDGDGSNCYVEDYSGDGKLISRKLVE